jgi:hypothetical protein
MKRISEDAIVALGFLLIAFFVFLFGFGIHAYDKYLDAYNTQRDREMFLKSYEIVIECRKSYGIGTRNPTISANEVCGKVPVFEDVVK